MSNIHTLYSSFGVSPWLDNLSRELIESGKLRNLVEQGIRGVTSNPSIFEKAFAEGIHYKEPLAVLKSQGKTTEEAYWTLAIEDIQHACDTLRSVYDDSSKDDGYVSLEVTPEFAQDAQATILQAKDLWARVDRPNLMIKIPATEACLPAITEVIASGINVNVTLIFSLHRYLQVINAYILGLERLSDPSLVRSVGSFFVSRVDSDIDPRLTDHAGLKGLAAVAQARAAYGIFLESFSPHAERWAKLEARGGRPQKALWASTSTKDPSYPDLKYVDGLLAKDSVNTMPDATLNAILEHAEFDSKHELNAEEIELAHEQLAELLYAGIHMQVVSDKLEKEGIEKFQLAFRAMLAALDSQISS
jgi:transaldolase